MKTPEPIQQLMMLHLLGGLSKDDERKLNEWRMLSTANERIAEAVTDKAAMREAFRRLDEAEPALLEKLHERFGFAWAGPKKKPAPVYRFLEMAAGAVIVAGVIIFILLNVDIGGPSKKQPTQNSQAYIINSDGLSTAVEDAKRGLRDGYLQGRLDATKTHIQAIPATSDPKAAPGKYNELRTLKTRYGLLLPDDHLAFLNEQSSVKYPANYSADSAGIIMEGEIYVELSPDKENPKPFHVLIAGGSLLEAREGRFNIHAYSTDSVVITSVNGLLQVYPAGSGSPLPVNEREQLQIVHGKINLLKDVDILKVIDWRIK